MIGRGGPLRPPVEAKSCVACHKSTYRPGLWTAESPDFRCQALQVANHDKQMASLMGEVSLLYRDAVNIFYRPSHSAELILRFARSTIVMYNIWHVFIFHIILQYFSLPSPLRTWKIMTLHIFSIFAN